MARRRFLGCDRVSLVLGLKVLLFLSRRLALVHAWQSSSSKESASRPSSLPIFFDSSQVLHRDIQYHPEQPARIELCVESLKKYKTQDQSTAAYDLVNVANENTDASIRHEPFSKDELAHARQILLETHNPDLVLQLEEKTRLCKEQRLLDGKEALGHMGYIDADTYLTTMTYDVCLRATAAWIRAVNVRGTAMALTRPPGHHATRNISNGFCVFNFAAAAAVHALLSDDTTKVSVLDWDVHYGQGVADILKDYERARYVSIHQTPAFPYQGQVKKVDGQYQNILTLPMPPETSWTCGYKALFDTALDFCCRKGEWEPDVVIVCAGYDALDSDELAGVSLQAPDFGKMTTRLCQHLAATSVTNGQQEPVLVLGLEGGYQLRPSAGGGNLADAVLETVQALLKNRSISTKASEFSA